MTDDMVTIDILKRMPRRSIGMRITDDGKVEVRAPGLMPMFVIRRFVESHRDWIAKTKRRMSTLPKAAKVAYREGSVFSIAGKPYSLHLTDGNAIVIAGSRIFFPKKFVGRPKAHMEQFLRKFAKTYLSERTAHFARVMGVTYKRVSIRDTSSRWGSCSSTGTISYAYRLILADPTIIDYVVIHELSHVTHKHHQAAFWNRVEEFYPDHKTARKWLTKYGHTLRI